MPKLSVFEALIKQKCPRCRQGDMFNYSSFNIRKFDQMNETCPVCDLKFEVEPGFFWGAMYISYAISVGIVLVIGFSIYFLGNPDLWVYLVVTTTFIIMPMPFVYRYSRVLFLYLFSGVDYNPDIQRKKS